MRRLILLALGLLTATTLFAQVDIEHRRLLSVQTAFPVAGGEEQIGGFGYYWFNENHYPWEHTALRFIFAGVYADAELSYFLPSHPATAIGLGVGGGAFIDSIVPYQRGERIRTQEFWGDNVNARVFINQTVTEIPFGDKGNLPVNLRATYGIAGSNYRDTGDTRNFTLPDNFLTQSVLAELRFGGIEPGQTAKRGAELYIAAESNYRTGFDAFGPTGALFPAHSTYERLFGSLGGKIPVGKALIFARASGGLGEHLDELSAYKLGGHIRGAEAFSYTMHGYYTREFFADDFGLVNLEVVLPITTQHNLALHLYGDSAVIHPIDVLTGTKSDWHSYSGVGAGISFRAWWQVNVLVTYGYGINGVRNSESGSHEIGLALEKHF